MAHLCDYFAWVFCFCFSVRRHTSLHPEAFSWEFRFLTSQAADPVVLSVETSIGTAGSFDSMRVWGRDVYMGSLSWHSTNPSKRFWQFLKPSSAVFRVQGTALTQCTQQFAFPMSVCLSSCFAHFSPTFSCVFETNSLIFSYSHFCISWLLSSTFGGWFIWKIAAYRLKIQCGRSEIITRQSVLSLNWNPDPDPFFVISDRFVASPSFIFSLSYYVFTLLHYLFSGGGRWEVSMGGTVAGQSM